MKTRMLAGILLPLALSGCAEQFLSTEETRVIGPDAATALSVAPKTLDPSLLGQAATLADRLASAYFAAGVKAARAQDAVNAGVYLAAGSVAVGALGDATARVLTNRAFAGVALQSVGQNGLKKSEVQSLFSGATQLNCISSISRVYSSQSSELAKSPIAQHLAYAAMQEVRISARNVLVRDVESFTDVLKSLTDVVQTRSDDTEAALAGDATPTAPLNAFAAKLGGCISSAPKQGEEE